MEIGTPGSGWGLERIATNEHPFSGTEFRWSGPPPEKELMLIMTHEYLGGQP